MHKKKSHMKEKECKSEMMHEKKEHHKDKHKDGKKK
jgi:hypothetical protein